MSDRIMIFIPVYNCEKQLPRALAKIDARVQSLVEEIVVIDNRSADATLDAGVAAARDLGLKVTFLRNRQNFSLGGSIKRAFLYAIEKKYDFMITLHGDDQGDIRDLLPMLESGDFRANDLTIGARFHPQSTLVGYSWTRIAGNRLLNAACSLIAQRRVDDLIAGLNIFRVAFFRDRFFLRFPDNLTFDVHVLLYAFSRNAKVAYAPITWREEDQISNAKVFKQAFIILRLFADYVLDRKGVFADDKSGRPAGFAYESRCGGRGMKGRDRILFAGAWLALLSAAGLLWFRIYFNSDSLFLEIFATISSSLAARGRIGVFRPRPPICLTHCCILSVIFSFPARAPIFSSFRPARPFFSLWRRSGSGALSAPTSPSRAGPRSSCSCRPRR